MERNRDRQESQPREAQQSAVTVMLNSRFQGKQEGWAQDPRGLRALPGQSRGERATEPSWYTVRGAWVLVLQAAGEETDGHPHCGLNRKPG
jgi:hypothetical protein